MNYVTLDDLILAVGEHLVLQLTDDDNDGAADARVIDDVCGRATREVNMRVASTHTIRKFSDPEILQTVRDCALDIAVQMMYLRRPSFFDGQGRTPWHSRYQHALELLKQVREAVARFDTNGSPQAPANTGGSVSSGTFDNRPLRKPYFTGGTGFFLCGLTLAN